MSKKKNGYGFTIVELLIVIVIIGILAAITIVSYTGITKKANESTLQSDLANSKKQFALYYTEHGVYPTSLDSNKCLTNTTQTPNTDTNYCLKPTSDTVITISEADGTKYKLTATKAGITYSITEDSTPSVSVLLPESDWITIGTQRWARKNLNVGTRINGSQEQTNNGGTNVVEKYCYGDTDAGCTNTDANGISYGALYQWDEAMNYSTAEGAQGICPAGSHVPSDNDWKILEMQLGMTQAAADTTGWRGTNEGAQLKPAGSSGLDVPIAGYRYLDGSFAGLMAYSFIWSSSAYGGDFSWGRRLEPSQPGVTRGPLTKTIGYSIRCLGN